MYHRHTLQSSAKTVNKTIWLKIDTIPSVVTPTFTRVII